MYHGAVPAAMLPPDMGGSTGLEDGGIRRGRDWVSGLRTEEYVKKLMLEEQIKSAGMGPFEAFSRRDLPAPPGRW